MDVVNRIIDTLKDEQNLSWQSLIYEIVKQEGLDPWDIDVSVLSQRFMEIISQMKSVDFFLSGKVVLTASMLLKYKAENLSNSDFDIFSSANEELIEDSDFLDYSNQEGYEEIPLIPEEEEILKNLKLRTPIRTSRKVSLFDLVSNLERAMKVYKRKVERHNVKRTSTKKIDKELQDMVEEKYPEMSYLVDQVYNKIHSFNEERIKFSKLVGTQDKTETIYTFIPLLQMRNNDVIDLDQQDHFQDFDVIPTNNNNIINL
ncbi:MAG: segregation/condensation protein A [Candidatus Nanoarchaeia archaeon]|nr:segregation/condensation protein A [Candidatus Nanoarchaeia archaeon]